MVVKNDGPICHDFAYKKHESFVRGFLRQLTISQKKGKGSRVSVVKK